jgi:hypothetical protein
VTSVERLATERGMQLGFELGMQLGMQQGLEIGRIEGGIIILCRVLIHRFGHLSQHVLDRFARADFAQIETWAVRALDAASLDEVFTED